MGTSDNPATFTSMIQGLEEDYKPKKRKKMAIKQQSIDIIDGIPYKDLELAIRTLLHYIVSDEEQQCRIILENESFLSHEQIDCLIEYMKDNSMKHLS